MATLSESQADYDLIFDSCLPGEQELIVLETQQIPEQQNLLPRSSGSITLYQRNYSSRIEPDQVPPDQLDLSDSRNFEVDMEESSFQWEMFIRSFLISFFYMSGIGMFLSWLLRCCHSTFYRNYFLYTDTYTLKLYGGMNFLFFLVFLTRRLYDKENKEKPEFGDLFSPLPWICLMSAAIEAYWSQKMVKILKTIKLDEKSFSSSRFGIDSFWISDLSLKIKDLETQRKAEGVPKEIKKEKETLMKELEEYEMIGAIQTTISRLDIDISLYYLSFFEKTPQNLLRECKKRQDLQIIEKGNFLIYNKKFPEHDLLKAIKDFESNIFYYKYCTKPNQYDEKKAYAYTLALDLLFKKKQKTSGTFILIAIFLGSIFLLMLAERIPVRLKGMFHTSTGTIFALIFLPFVIYVTSLPFRKLLFLIFQGIKIMESKYIYMKELQKLISAEKPGEEQSYPTLNILDFRSLESWACLRKIFLNMYDEKLQRIILALALILVIESTLWVRMCILSLTNSQCQSSIFLDNRTAVLLYGLQIIFFLTVLLIFAFHAARVNAQFKAHRNLIRANKKIATSLYKYYSDFIGENALEPGTYIYNEGLKFLKKEYGENLTPETQKKMKQDSRKLIETYEEILEELKHEEAENSIRILGVRITLPRVKKIWCLSSHYMYFVACG